MSELRTFKDVDGNQWAIRLDTEIVQTLKDEGLLDIDELDTKPERVFGPIIDGNREWLPKVLCICVDEQRQKNKVEKIRFDGEALDDGAEQLQLAIVDYFPKSKRPALLAALNKTETANELMMTKAIQVLEGTEVQKAMETAAEKMATEVKQRIGS